ncbi:MAG: hypothetical protein E2O68_08775 [Deltaproteobacteria bacterium]|nr:MAG: hypothetical protein E2O68_08775 [Deltaproteobacteria bacterium]
MQNFIFNLTILFTIISCNGGGEGGGTSTAESLPSGTVIEFSEFKKLIPNDDPKENSAYSFKGDFNFNKENKTCSGNIDSFVSINVVRTNVTSNGYCKGKNIEKGIKAQGLEFLNFDKISEALGEDLKIEDLGGGKFRLSFENQGDSENSEYWSRSYTFKIDEELGTIIFPVTLRYNYKDQMQKMNWKIDIERESLGGEIIDRNAPATKILDAMDIAESGIYSIF